MCHLRRQPLLPRRVATRRRHVHRQRRAQCGTRHAEPTKLSTQSSVCAISAARCGPWPANMHPAPLADRRASLCRACARGPLQGRRCSYNIYFGHKRLSSAATVRPVAREGGEHRRNAVGFRSSQTLSWSGSRQPCAIPGELPANPPKPSIQRDAPARRRPSFPGVRPSPRSIIVDRSETSGCCQLRVLGARST